MRRVLCLALVMCLSAGCAQTPAPETASIVTPSPTVVVVEKPVVVEKQVILDLPS